MKKILILAIVLIACKKDKVEPVKPTTPPAAPSYNKATLRGLDSLLVGKWELDSGYTIQAYTDTASEFVDIAVNTFQLEFTDTVISGDSMYFKSNQSASGWVDGYLYPDSKTWRLKDRYIEGLHTRLQFNSHDNDTLIYLDSNKMILGPKQYTHNPCTDTRYFEVYKKM